MERRAFMGASLAALSTSAIAADLSPTIDFSGIHWTASNQNNKTEDEYGYQ